MTIFTKRIAATADDCRAYGANFITNNIQVGDYSGVSADAFFRFTNVTIPQGATIISAKLTLTANANKSGATCNLIVYGNLMANSVSPTSSAELYALDLTVANAPWNAVGSWTNGTEYDTVDFTDVISEITSQGGWGSGNALGILLMNNSSSANANREAYDYVTDSAKAALLTVEYSVITYLDTSAALVGVWVLAAIARLVHVVIGNLVGSWTLAAIGRLVRTVQAALTGSWVLAAIARVVKAVQAALTWVGSLVASWSQPIMTIAGHRDSAFRVNTRDTSFTALTRDSHFTAKE